VSEVAEARRSSTSFRKIAISFAALIVLYPFFTGGTPRHLFFNLLMTVTVFYGISAASDSRMHRTLALAFALPWFSLAWAELVYPAAPLWLGVSANVFALLFFILTLYVMLSFVMKAERVDGDLIWAAVAIYLILGGIWYGVYYLVESALPGSFVHTATDIPIDQDELFYFSFVTLTTLGFGDVVPANPVARHAVIAEAIAGVLYLPIVLSRLVGAYAAAAVGSASAESNVPE